MGTSRVPVTIDALVAAFRAAGLNTFDGPPITGDWSVAVFVGYDAGGEDSEFRAVTTTQSWASLGAKARNEEFSVFCGIAAVDGGGVTKVARDAAYSVMATVETVLRADPSLGQTPPFTIAVASGDLYQFPVESGMECRLPFTISVVTRI